MAGGFDRRQSSGADRGAEGATVPGPGLGKVTLVEQLQMRMERAGSRAEQDPADVQAAAAQGVAGAGSPLPHADAIQRLFGRHDISRVEAHVGGDAATASRAIGAEAYATGSHVAFASSPDLHTAAHEAAHVVQQRGGVQLKGGVGDVGDAYERHADEVAAQVVQGKSAEPLLDHYAGAGQTSAPAAGSLQRAAQGAVVQRKLKFLAGTEYLDPDRNTIAVPGYATTLRAAIDMKPNIDVINEAPAEGTAAYRAIPSEREGEIRVQPLPSPETDVANKTAAYNDRLIAMAHETRHGVDDLNRDVPGFRTQKDAKIRTEWRAFATQSATSMSLKQQGKKFSDRFELDIAPFASKATFMAPTSRMVDVTKSYMRLYEINKDPSTEYTVKFMKDHEDWVQEAVDLYHALSVEKDAPKE
jgi:hypothetical protein